MLISQPDSSTSRLMFLPPGPINAPIFSGLILMVSMRGAYLLISLRGAEIVFAISARMCMRATRAFSTVSAISAMRNAAQLQVQLETGDAFFRAGDLAIHVAERVFPADDVGEQFVLRDFLVAARRSVQMPMLMPATGRIIGTPASINASAPPQTEAMEVEPFDSMISLVTRIA